MDKFDMLRKGAKLRRCNKLRSKILDIYDIMERDGCTDSSSHPLFGESENLSFILAEFVYSNGVKTDYDRFFDRSANVFSIG